MPAHAARHVEIDHCVRLANIAPLLVQLAAAPPLPRPATQPLHTVEIEVNIANQQNAIEAGIEKLGQPSPLACPECHGVLRTWEDGRIKRFRCHTGHAYSAASLVAAVRESVEESLWTTLRSIEESVMLLRQLASEGEGTFAEDYAVKAARAEGYTDRLRELLTRLDEFTVQQP